MPGPASEGMIEATVEAIGEADGLLGGQLFTFLRVALAPTDTAILVESTNGWPDTGSVRVHQEVIRYESKTADTFNAVERDVVAVAVPRGGVVYNEGVHSEVESFKSQIVYPTATGENLLVLLRNHGLPVPPGLGDSELRAFGQFASYPPAGPLRTIADCLELVRPGQMRFGTVVAGAFGATLTLDGAGGGWPDMSGRLVRFLPPSANAGLYRIGNAKPIGGNVAHLIPAAGPYWDSASQIVTDANPAAVELVPWDLHEDPASPARFFVDALEFAGSSSIKGAAYLQGGELGVSVAASTVSTVHPILQVLGVFLAGDVERQGTNYWLSGSFLGSTITLGTPLPSATEPVFVDYGAADYTAQALPGPQVSGEFYFPFYLADPTSGLDDILYVVRAAGMLPVIQSIVV